MNRIGMDSQTRRRFCFVITFFTVISHIIMLSLYVNFERRVCHHLVATILAGIVAYLLMYCFQVQFELVLVYSIKCAFLTVVKGSFETTMSFGHVILHSLLGCFKATFLTNLD